MTFTGAMTALVTPMRDGQVDDKALQQLVEEQIAGGIDALVPCGTTGESPTLSSDEQAHVVKLVVKAAKKRVPVIAGAGSASTAHALELGRAARAAGADGLLAVTPYYNKPTQEGLYQHYRALVEAADLPTVLYNVPGRTGSDLQVETVARLCDLPRIVAIKEATGSVARTQQILARCGSRLVVLCGDDTINYPLYCVGARGCISVVSNVAPALVAEVWDRTQAGEHVQARAAATRANALAEALFAESNPIPVKTALSLMGLCTSEMRLPLVQMSGPARERLRAVLSEHGLV